LIEVTAIDLTKANIVLNILCTLFGEYCENKFIAEQVEILDELTGKLTLTPVYEYREVPVTLKYLTTTIGTEIQIELVEGYLHKMQLPCKIKDDIIIVSIPPTRADILHPCDILEDVAIGYGFNKILESATLPLTISHGKEQPINLLSDRLRREIALAGYTEVLTFSLCSRKENFEMLNLKDDNNCVTIDNPQNLSFQVCRTSLYPGLLKTLKNSKKLPLPLSIFEVSDIVVLDSSQEVGSTNVRCLCAMEFGLSAEFETAHGLLDRIMSVLDILHQIKYKEWFIHTKESGKKSGEKSEDTSKKVYNSFYYIKEGNCPTYLPKRCAEVMLVPDVQKRIEVSIGFIGILHPDVVSNYKLVGMITAVHLNISKLQDVFFNRK